MAVSDTEGMCSESEQNRSESTLRLPTQNQSMSKKQLDATSTAAGKAVRERSLDYEAMLEEKAQGNDRMCRYFGIKGFCKFHDLLLSSLRGTGRAMTVQCLDQARLAGKEVSG